MELTFNQVNQDIFQKHVKNYFQSKYKAKIATWSHFGKTKNPATCNFKYGIETRAGTHTHRKKTPEWSVVKTKSKNHKAVCLPIRKSSYLSKQSMKFSALVVYVQDESGKDCPYERDKHDTDMFSSCARKILKPNKSVSVPESSELTNNNAFKSYLFSSSCQGFFRIC